MFFKKTLMLFVSFLVCLDLFGEIRETSFLRQDGSAASVYINTPENNESFPLVVYIDGSNMQSVNNNFTVLSYLFNLKQIGVIAIEKRGITKDNIHYEEFLNFDCYENRLQDYIQLINELDEKEANWNGQIIFIGSSEGGKIAPQLSLHFAYSTKGIILIGSGGGLSFGEEIKYQIKQIAIENEAEFNESELDQLIEDQYAKILSDPHSLKTYYDKTYKWLASYLKYNLLEDLLCIEAPILMIHGALDTQIPVESADLIKIAFDDIKKENLTYFRSDDLGHSINKRMDIFLLLLNYSFEHFENEAVIGF